jgi:hypothetical protein
MNVVEVGTDGTLTLPNVAPGEYRLDVQARSSLEAVGQTGRAGMPQTPDAPEYASLPVSVTGEDIEGITVRTTRGHRMTGRLVVEGAAAGTDILRRIKVWTYDLQAGLGLSVTLTGAGADGSFRVSPLPAGTYLIAVVDDLVDGEWAEPENLERLRPLATKVTVAEGELKTVTLRVSQGMKP